MEKHHRNFSSSGFRFLYRESVLETKISGDSRSIVRYHMYAQRCSVPVHHIGIKLLSQGIPRELTFS